MVWSVAVTAANSENCASAEIKVVGIDTYFPKLATIEALRGRIVERQKPLFPGYLFYYFTEAWGLVRQAQHVVGVLMWGETPARLSDAVVAELHQREASDGAIHLEGPKKRRRFRKGMHVKFNGGALQGLSGIVAGMSGGERVQVLMDLLGRQTPVTVQETDLAMI